jgi:hypothetical protein
MSSFYTNKLHVVAPVLALAIGAAAGSLVADDMTLSAGKLAKDAKNYYGRMVTVKAEVEDVIDSRTFTLDEDAILTGADVLVLVPAGYTGTLAHDQVVTVTGKVRPYVATELEHDYRWFQGGKIVSRDSKVDFKTRPVLVADSVRTADGRELLSGGAVSMSDEHAGHMMADRKMDHDHDKMKGDHHDMKMEGHDHAGMMVSAGKLSKDGKKYYGQSVTVRSEVEDVLDMHSFTLDDDTVIPGPDVVVLVPAGFDTTALAHDQVVTVTGKVRPYVMADLSRDFDWFKNGKIVTMDTKTDYKTRPVLVAESITMADGRMLTLSSQR